MMKNVISSKNFKKEEKESLFIMNQMKFPVITIAREYGAGGRSVASLLAEKLNVPWYDKDFIITTAENSGLSIEQISKDSEEIGDREKFIDTLIGGGSMHDKVFYAQREVIIDLALLLVVLQKQS